MMRPSVDRSDHAYDHNPSYRILDALSQDKQTTPRFIQLASCHLPISQDRDKPPVDTLALVPFPVSWLYGIPLTDGVHGKKSASM